jgi:hypothetical protein
MTVHVWNEDPDPARAYDQWPPWDAIGECDPMQWAAAWLERRAMMLAERATKAKGPHLARSVRQPHPAADNRDPRAQACQQGGFYKLVREGAEVLPGVPDRS